MIMKPNHRLLLPLALALIGQSLVSVHAADGSARDTHLVYHNKNGSDKSSSAVKDSTSSEKYVLIIDQRCKEVPMNLNFHITNKLSNNNDQGIIGNRSTRDLNFYVYDQSSSIFNDENQGGVHQGGTGNAISGGGGDHERNINLELPMNLNFHIYGFTNSDGEDQGGTTGQDTHRNNYDNDMKIEDLPINLNFYIEIQPNSNGNNLEDDGKGKKKRKNNTNIEEIPINLNVYTYDPRIFGNPEDVGEYDRRIQQPTTGTGGGQIRRKGSTVRV